jgi:hypothetical protein
MIKLLDDSSCENQWWVQHCLCCGEVSFDFAISVIFVVLGDHLCVAFFVVVVVVCPSFAIILTLSYCPQQVFEIPKACDRIVAADGSSRLSSKSRWAGCAGCTATKLRACGTAQQNHSFSQSLDNTPTPHLRIIGRRCPETKTQR